MANNLYIKHLDCFSKYKLSATEYKKKHNPIRVGKNAIGDWYEHPIFGDETGLLLVPEDTDVIYKTDERDVPPIEAFI
tara:strand:- start:9 stop:242 length:234 start_codon:yes stop_codon:yes gene_type:complete